MHDLLLRGMTQTLLDSGWGVHQLIKASVSVSRHQEAVPFLEAAHCSLRSRSQLVIVDIPVSELKVPQNEVEVPAIPMPAQIGREDEAALRTCTNAQNGGMLQLARPC